MLTKEQKEKYMHLAFEQAKKAEEQGEVPIGAEIGRASCRERV